MRMTGYTKLFGTILASSVWQESNETRIIWITMLAAANKWGVVEAAVPGLAHMAKLSVAATVEALKVLEAPDEYSRTPDFEGRRIKVVDGGWQILNHDKYKEKMGVDERREYNRQKQAEFRERQKERESSKKCQTKSITVNHGQSESALSAHSDSDSDSDKSLSEKKKRIPRNPPKAKFTDEEWLAHLRDNPDFQGIDIDKELQNCKSWCDKKPATFGRRRFEIWLSKADKPIGLEIRPPSTPSFL